MATLTASEACVNLYRLMDQAAQSHQPIVISANAAMRCWSAKDWDSIQETLFLLSVPGVRESIKAGMAEPVGSCAEKLDW